MRISPSGIELIKRFEGLELEAYQDVAGVWTIGYGHTGRDVVPGRRITPHQAEALLRRDMRSREDAVRRLVRKPLAQNEFDALVSFVYNVGEGAFARSTALKRLNAGDRLGAAEALGWWNKATIAGRLTPVTGLTRRRAAEQALFMTPSGAPPVRDLKMLAENTRVPAIETAPRRGSLAGSRTVQGATVAGGAGVAATTMNGEESAPGEAPAESSTTTAAGAPPPLPEYDAPYAQEQIELALMILIICAVAYILFARIDDWRKYKR